MEAHFKKTHPIISLVFLILDLLWIGLCVYMSIAQRITGGDVLVCALVAIFFAAFGAIPYLYNRRAYLHINDCSIKGRFGFFKRLECEIREVEFVLVQLDTVQLLFKDRKCCIRGVRNAWEIGAYLMPRIPFRFDREQLKLDRKAMLADWERRNKSIKKNTVASYCAIALTFVWLFATIILTGERDLPEFSSTDWIIFWIMCVLEALTFGAMILFIIKIRQANPFESEKLLYKVHRATVEATPLLESPWELRAVLTDAYYTHRITVYNVSTENIEERFYYTIEIFDGNFRLKLLNSSDFFEDAAYPGTFENCLDITECYI